MMDDGWWMMDDGMYIEFDTNNKSYSQGRFMKKMNKDENID